MPGARGALPHLVIGLLTVLVAGAVALSLTTAPPAAQQQLRFAAADTASSGFVLTDVNSATPLRQNAANGATPEAQQTVVHASFEPPDRLSESAPTTAGRTISVVVVGEAVFKRIGTLWTKLPSSPGLGGQVLDTVLLPLDAASSATAVTRQGDVYRFGPAHVEHVAQTLLGRPLSQLSSLRLSAVVRGDDVVEEQVAADSGGDLLEVHLAFSAIGSAPSIGIPLRRDAASGAG
jgi:hypothetical protein